MHSAKYPSRVLALIALVGLILTTTCQRHRTPPDGAAHTTVALPSTPARVTARHELNITGLSAALAARPLDERPQQMLDLAVYGTLIAEGVEPAVLRDVLHDAPLLRDGSLSDLVAEDAEAGRRVVLSDGRALLFADAHDRHPRVTLGRLADRIRAERGSPPASVEVWRVTASVGLDRIVVERLATVPGAELFTAAYGYVERRVTRAEELGQFLAAVDDLTWVRRDASGLTLGGRRGISDTHDPRQIAHARVDLDDVATLYRAQQEIAPRVAPIFDAAGLGPILRDAYNAMVGAHNAAINGAPLDHVTFDQNARLLAQSLHLELPASHPTLASQRATLELVGPRLGDALAGLRQRAEEAQEALEREHRVLALGFSLDPAIHREPLLDALRRLASDAPQRVAEARAFDRARGTRDLTRTGGTSLTVAAQRLAAAVRPGDEGTLASRVSPALPRVQRAIREIEATTDRDAVSRAALALKADLSREPGVAAHLVRYALARQQVQCARYDGRIAQTRVGMTLFYCDLLAKIWGTVEHPSEAPVDSVVGIQSVVANRESAPAVATEERNRATRVWFGPRPDAAMRLPREGGFAFAPWFTRMFAASSDPTRRGKEGVPNEPERRMVDWWNRHLTRIADFEPQYHRQNEILKWSSTAAFLVRHHLLPDLERVAQAAQARGQTFDQWLTANRATLRGADGLGVLPRARWIGDTECIDLLTSRTYPDRNGERWIEGGVNGGGLLTAREIQGVRGDQPEPRRRTGTVPVETRPNASRVPERELFATFEDRPGVALATVTIEKPERRADLARAGRPTRLQTEVVRAPPDPAAPGVQRVVMKQETDRGALALVGERKPDGRVDWGPRVDLDLLRANPPTGPPRPPADVLAAPVNGPDEFRRALDELRDDARRPNAGGAGEPPRPPPHELMAGFYEESRGDPGAAKRHYDRAFHDLLPPLIAAEFVRYSRQYGHDAGEYLRVQSGHAHVAESDRGRFSLAPYEGRLRVAFAVTPDIPRQDSSLAEVFTAWRASRRGGRTDVYPEPEVFVASGLAHEYNFAADAVGSLTTLHQDGGAPVSRVNVGLRVGTAHATLAQRPGVEYVRVLGHAPTAPSPQRDFYLVEAPRRSN